MKRVRKGKREKQKILIDRAEGGEVGSEGMRGDFPWPHGAPQYTNDKFRHTHTTHR